jgi:triphosphoribosyl-dephospho-CoA synthetase
MISDRDVWATALLIVKRYGVDATLEATQRADQLLHEGDMVGAETWQRILNAVERLQVQKPAEDEAVH